MRVFVQSLCIYTPAAPWTDQAIPERILLLLLRAFEVLQHVTSKPEVYAHDRSRNIP
ncbi:hypothetical protein SCLCIDRAFT_1214784 [Scleroderma citrinum Foug A]|uniref:Uncharacterized protein n=1 Tax=Scleroderma citrinum Foug A TaxID=1036808 RepID=A0A0C2ZM98_9AGAM|nr:hypothetical protein SCLCIDRAFT_1214784 [Scleroderma citrinum Foug A]